MNTVVEKKTHHILANSAIFLNECKIALKKIKDSEAEIVKDQKNRTTIKNYGLVEKLFINEPKRIVGKFDLPANWEAPIRDFLITGELHLPDITGTQPVLTFNYKTRKWELFIQIFQNTKKQDLQNEDIWDLIEQLKTMISDYKPIQINEADLALLKMSDQGFTTREIGEKLQEQKLVSSFDEQDLRKRLKLLQEKLWLSKDKKLQK